MAGTPFPAKPSWLLRLVGLRHRAPNNIGHIRTVLLFFFEEGLIVIARGRLVLALHEGLAEEARHRSRERVREALKGGRRQSNELERCARR